MAIVVVRYSRRSRNVVARHWAHAFARHGILPQNRVALRVDFRVRVGGLQCGFHSCFEPHMNLVLGPARPSAERDLHRFKEHPALASLEPMCLGLGNVARNHSDARTARRVFSLLRRPVWRRTGQFPFCLFAPDSRTLVKSTIGAGGTGGSSTGGAGGSSGGVPSRFLAGDEWRDRRLFQTLMRLISPAMLFR